MMENTVVHDVHSNCLKFCVIWSMFAGDLDHAGNLQSLQSKLSLRSLRR